MDYYNQAVEVCDEINQISLDSHPVHLQPIIFNKTDEVTFRLDQNSSISVMNWSTREDMIVNLLSFKTYKSWL